MQPGIQAPRRHTDGSLDIGFYRRRARRARQLARGRMLQAVLRFARGGTGSGERTA